jgi:hypothetical protein
VQTNNGETVTAPAIISVNPDGYVEPVHSAPAPVGGHTETEGGGTTNSGLSERAPLRSAARIYKGDGYAKSERNTFEPKLNPGRRHRQCEGTAGASIAPAVFRMLL